MRTRWRGLVGGAAIVFIGVASLVGCAQPSVGTLGADAPRADADDASPGDAMAHGDARPHGDAESLIQPTAKFDAALTAIGLAHEYHVSPGGHTQRYWAEHLADYLGFYTAGWFSEHHMEVSDGQSIVSAR